MASRLSAEVRRGKPDERHPTYTHRVLTILRAAIRNGDIPPGSVLDEQILAQQLESSRNAVREALQMLAKSGLVTRDRGRPTRVIDTIHTIPGLEFWVKPPPDLGVRVVEIERTIVSTTGKFFPEQFTRIHDKVFLVEHLILREDVPHSLRGTYLPLEPEPTPLLERIAELPDVYEEMVGIALLPPRCYVDAIACDPRTSRLLQVPESSPILARETVFYDLFGTPRVIGFQYYRAGKVSISAG